ncbi:MAG: hypothetical protein KDE14_09145 [Rhodobacteraceae bacterium]|nr:hypothetical protein [Paracoccaceae bacterium]
MLLRIACIFTLISYASNAAAQEIVGCAPSQGVEVICGLTKPEDIAALTDTDWLLVSELGDAATPGNIVAYNTSDGTLLRLKARDDSAASDPARVCGPMPERLRPRGFHVRMTGEGQYDVLLINVMGGQRIENYVVTLSDGDPALAWRGCVAVPDKFNVNDVAPLPGGGFVVSHMYDEPRTWLTTLKFIFHVDTGYAVSWRPGAEWVKVDGSDVTFANGIEVNPDTGEIYLAGTYGEELVAIDPSKNRVRRVSMPIQPDNLTWQTNGKILAVGHTGIPIWGTRKCRALAGKPCSFDFAVIQIDPRSLSRKVLFADRRGAIPGPSVALGHDDAIYLGTVFGDRISRIYMQGMK